MALEFAITGGWLTLPKPLFVRELLSPASPLRRLLNYEVEKSQERRRLCSQNSGTGDVVRIDFSAGSDVPVGEDFENLVGELKARYRGKLQGRVTLVAHSYHVYALELDLSRDDGEVRTIH